MNRHRIVNNPYALMAAILMLWGSFTATSKLLLESLDSFQVLFYIFGIATFILTVIMCRNGRLQKFRELTWKDFIFLFLSAFISFLYYFMYMLALKMIPAVEASMLNYLFPIMIVIFAVPIHGEKLNKAKLLSIIMGFLGMSVIITNGRLNGITFSNLPGDLLAIGAALCWGLFSNLGRKSKIDQYLTNYVYVIVSFVLSLISMTVFSNFIFPGLKAFAGISWISISNIVLSYFLWFKVLKIADSALVASLSFITPFVTLVFITVLLGEKISIIQVSGLFLILLGAAIQNIGHSAENRGRQARKKK